jgi:GNAT superfamily N-acetyltransferase
MEIDVRPEALDGVDGARLLGAFAEEIASLYPGWHPGIGPSADPDEFAHARGRFLVAYQGDRALGCGGVKRLDEATGEVKRLYVVPDARGEGVARQLLRALEDAAEELGLHTVRLDTGARQPEALALFRSAGYREIPDYNGNPYASHWLEKSLA